MPGIIDYLADKYDTKNIKAINERLVELSSLFEISQILNSSIELNSVLNNILLIPMGRLLISKGTVLIRNSTDYSSKFSKGIAEEKTCEIRFTVNELPPDIYTVPDELTNASSYYKFDGFMKDHNLSIAIPLKSHDRLVGLAIYGNKLNNQDFSEEEINFLSSLANISATSVENALKVDEIRSINQQLDEKIQQLKTLFDIAQGLSATLDSEKIAKLLTYALMGQMLVYHYAVIIFGNQTFQKLECKGFQRESIESIAGQLMELRDIDTGKRIQSISHLDLKTKLDNLGARVFIPMRHQGKTIGIILLGDKINKQQYTDLDLEFLSTLVNQAVISLENARLFKETLEKQRIEQELQVAKNIQKKLLPKDLPEIDGYDIWGLNISSKEVGGDYFDVIPISQDKFAFAIGDVSGKSVPASLLMANLQAGLRSLITEDIPLQQVVGKLNNLIYANTEMDKYITFFIGILNVTTGELVYVNAGHNQPMLIDKAGNIALLDIGGIILGMMLNFSYQTGSVEFKSGDLLLSYTDGVNEAINPEEEEFGEERLEKLLKSHRDKSAKMLAETVEATIQNFAEGTPQADDITLLITKKL